MNNLEAMALMMENKFGVNNIEGYIEYTNKRISKADEIISAMSTIENNDEYIETEKKIKSFCLSWLKWWDELPYRKVMEIYSIKERQAPQSTKIRPIDLNYECDRAYLRCVIHRDMNKNHCIGEREKAIHSTKNEFSITDDGFRVYSPSLKEGYIYDAINKQIVLNFKE